MKCAHCGEEIAQARIDFFKESGEEVTTCVKCSKVQKKIVLMEYSHKTAGTAVIIPNKPDGMTDQEQLRLARRAFNRSR